MIIHRLPEIDKAIWNKVGDHAKAPKKAKRGAHHNNIRISDDTILAMRRMHEIDGKPLSAVQAAYPDISPDYVRNVLDYITRTNLRLGKRP